MAALLVANALGCSTNNRTPARNSAATDDSLLIGTYAHHGGWEQTLRLLPGGAMNLTHGDGYFGFGRVMLGRWSRVDQNVVIAFSDSAGRPSGSTMTLLLKDGRLVPEQWVNYESPDWPAFVRVEEAVAPLLGGAWEWRGTRRSYDDIVPSGSRRYMIEFNSDDEVDVKSDCHFASGRFAVADSGRLTISQFVLGHSPCGPGSSSTDFENGLAGTANYFMRGDTLMIELQGNAGTMRFVRPAG